MDEIVRGGGLVHSNLFERIIAPENLFAAWHIFRRGKTSKQDVQEFEFNLEDQVFALHEDLKNGSYQHGTYESFYVCDPKRRHIHKPPIRDRLLHHAVCRSIGSLVEKHFIFDSWSCRKGKGTHAAIARFQSMGWTLSRNNTRPVWVLKLDIRKFFDSVDQDRLLHILAGQIHDCHVIALLTNIVRSFPSGIPLGNLTSQLFANIYLNELDQFVKHVLRIRCYLRYCDDFVLLHDDRSTLVDALSKIQRFVFERLGLEIHPRKILLERYSQGVDFLGFVCFPSHRILRTKTKRRMLQRVNDKNKFSYLGLLHHARTYQLNKIIFEKGLTQK